MTRFATWVSQHQNFKNLYKEWRPQSCIERQFSLLMLLNFTKGASTRPGTSSSYWHYLIYTRHTAIQVGVYKNTQEIHATDEYMHNFTQRQALTQKTVGTKKDCVAWCIFYWCYPRLMILLAYSMLFFIPCFKFLIRFILKLIVRKTV